MAVSIPSVGTTSETAANVATPTTLTPGLPATRAVGDVLLCITVCRSGTPTVSCSTSGWVELANVSGTNGRLALYAALVTGSEVAAQPVWASLTTGTSGTGASAQIAAVRGLDFSQSPLTGLVHQLSAAQNQAASTTVQAMGATITPTKANSAIFSLAVRQDNDVTDANWPVIATANNITWAKVAAVLNSGSGLDHAQSFQWGQQGAATAIAAKTVTVVAGSSDASSAILISLLTAQTKALGVTTETDAAQALSKTQQAQSKTLTSATETDAAQALSKTQSAQSKTLTATAGTDAAQPLDYEIVSSEQHKNLVAAAETDEAVAVSFTQQAQSKTVGQALETDAAQAVSFTQAAQSVSVTAGGESDAAQALSTTQAPQTETLTATAETDLAQALSFAQDAQTVDLTATVETDTAVALSVTQEAQDVFLTAVAESDAAMALSTGSDIHPAFSAATETDAAVAFSFTQGPAQSVSIAASTETGIARPLTYVQQPLSATLSPASELDTATPLAVPQASYTLVAATSTNTAMRLDVVGGSGYAAATGGRIAITEFVGIVRARKGYIDQPDTGVIV